jgi:hypothetical protein
MKYKSFKEYYWKRAAWTLGIPWGLATGIFFALDDNKWTLTGIINNHSLVDITGLLIAGFLFAFLYGRSRWKQEVLQEKENMNPSSGNE